MDSRHHRVELATRQKYASECDVTSGRYRTCCHVLAAMYLLPLIYLLPCTCRHILVAMYLPPYTCCHVLAAIYLLPCTCRHIRTCCHVLAAIYLPPRVHDLVDLLPYICRHMTTCRLDKSYQQSSPQRAIYTIDNPNADFGRQPCSFVCDRCHGDAPATHVSTWM